ncbi:MAG TPA: PH domain-containing protein [Bacilli bacterium]|nr:PH domain-containing protein [Bacilli bacterium]
MKNEKSNQIVNFDKILTKDEKIFWSGKPCKKAYILYKFLKLLPIAILWGAIDFGFIFVLVKSNMESLWFIIPFFALHLAPVWMWLGSIVTANRRWKNAQYAVTNKRIIIQTGFIGMEYKTIYYKEIKNVYLKIGIIEKLFGVGSIYFDTTGMGDYVAKVESSQVSPRVFQCVENVYELYSNIQKTVMDIQTDIEYPNQLRPNTNTGYNTEYDKKF